MVRTLFEEPAAGTLARTEAATAPIRGPKPDPVRPMRSARAPPLPNGSALHYGDFVPELLCLRYSPWSEKARWALAARSVSYTHRTYSPLLGEPALRLKLRRLSGPVSVPVLTDDDGRVYSDSSDIARWADARGEGPRLFPEGQDARIAEWVALSERGLSAGRGLSLRRLLTDDEGLFEMVPRKLRSLGGAARAIAAFGVRRTLAKYGAADRSNAELEGELGQVLETLRGALAKVQAEGDGGPWLLLGTFSFADVAMAQVLAFVSPPAFGLRMGKATRRTFTDPALLARFPDLVAWRDALYERYRPRAPADTNRSV